MSSIVDPKAFSAMLRKKKKNQLRPDMDYAGQDAVDPNEAWDAKLGHEVNEAMDEPDHEPATPAEMGENDPSNDVAQLKRSVERIKKYFDAM